MHFSCVKLLPRKMHSTHKCNLVPHTFFLNSTAIWILVTTVRWRKSWGGITERKKVTEMRGNTLTTFSGTHFHRSSWESSFTDTTEFILWVYDSMRETDSHIWMLRESLQECWNQFCDSRRSEALLFKILHLPLDHLLINFEQTLDYLSQKDAVYFHFLALKIKQ